MLETLVISAKCELAEDSINLTAAESEYCAKWALAPQYDSCDGLPWRTPVPSVGISIEAIYSMWQGRDELNLQQTDPKDRVCLCRDARSTELLEKSDVFLQSSQSTLNS